MKRIILFCLAAIAVTLAACGGSENPKATRSEVILVTGATGTQGGAVARELAKRGFPVRGLTRNPESERAKELVASGIEMVKGDFDDEASLLAAMEGAYGVFAVTDFWEHGYDGEVSHGEKLVDAALATGIEHFVYTSVAGIDRYTGIPHFDSKADVEEYLRESGLNYSIVRPVEFMDNIHYLRQSLMSGVLYDPRDTATTHQWIAASDIGFFVGEAFSKPDEWSGKTLSIAGESISIAEFADILSRSLGIDIHHQQITWSSYEEQAGEEMTIMMRWFEDKGYDVDVEALRKEYPGLVTWPQYLERLDWD